MKLFLAPSLFVQIIDVARLLLKYVGIFGLKYGEFWFNRISVTSINKHHWQSCVFDFRGYKCEALHNAQSLVFVTKSMKEKLQQCHILYTYFVVNKSVL